MRPDQLKRIEELTESLSDRFIAEADPSEWPGAGKPLAEWSNEERGNAYWAKKNAMATGGVLRYTLDLQQHVGKLNPGSEEELDADMDKRIRDAEKRAERAVKQALDRAKSRA